MFYLDCTIRDGGYLNNWNFTDEQVLKCYESVSKAGLDYFEIGFRSDNNIVKNKGKWCYSTDEDIRIITDQYKGCKIAIMCKLYTFTLKDIQPRDKSPVDLIRFLIPFKDEQLNKSVITEQMIRDSCEMVTTLISLGYDVCINIACAHLLTKKDITLLIQYFKSTPILCIYLADTFGSFTSSSIKDTIELFHCVMHTEGIYISLGFHGHDNRGDAIEKTKQAITSGVQYIDSTIGGLGRGAGNTKSELLLTNCENIDIVPLLDYYFTYHNDTVENPWYSVAAMLQIHPDYVAELPKHSIQNTPRVYNLLKRVQRMSIENSTYFYDSTLITRLLNPKFTAVIPVRKGSQRVPNKNLKPFAGSSLLEIKIKSLLTVTELDEIIVNTDSEEAIQLAIKYGIKYHRREPYYASSECLGSDFWEHIAQVTDTDVMVITNCTAPLITSETISRMINIYKETDVDSVTSVVPVKEHMWLNNKPLNYDPSQAPNTQDLPNIVSLTYGACIISRDLQIKYKNVVGKNPYFYELDKIEGVDIDYPIEFEFAEFLYSN